MTEKFIVGMNLRKVGSNSLNEFMEARIESLRKQYESKILEADENIKLLLKTTTILPAHTNINNELNKWIEIKSSNLSKLQL